ncbi:hypothetical protein GGU11DRAFT_875238 [Lentinula aff. detonsa]|uniref:Uncharacterized protein n=1 Tax=Lentinula aff. detonsa TaxID=2804958 RepID=A0AA38KMM7_9AGAR|nr:hypothetical protein GGU10DRAFT_408360 [Lentinula aff. detonsa]KAJ3801449.1 hypothetical protein GGU11DRAFT_875238 [Lentinula aff. detonsa]
MRFSTVLIIASFLATVFAAPHSQINRRGESGQVSPLSPTGPHTSNGDQKRTASPSLTSEDEQTALPKLANPVQVHIPSGTLLLKSSSIGTQAIARSHEHPSYVDYPLSEYKGKADDFVLRVLLEARSPSDAGFEKMVGQLKAAGRWVDSGTAFLDDFKKKLSRPVVVLTKQKPQLKM